HKRHRIVYDEPDNDYLNYEPGYSKTFHDEEYDVYSKNEPFYKQDERNFRYYNENTYPIQKDLNYYDHAQPERSSPRRMVNAVNLDANMASSSIKNLSKTKKKIVDKTHTNADIVKQNLEFSQVNDNSTKVLFTTGFNQIKFIYASSLSLKPTNKYSTNNKGQYYNTNSAIFIIFGQIESAVVPSPDLAGKEFLFRDQKNGIGKCYFSQQGIKWPKLGRGKKVRLAGLYRENIDSFQVITARELRGDYEIKNSFALARCCERELIKTKNIFQLEQ
ncbi:MAG: hypothetical protein MHPSP_001746, partial [Paramarteilia canceri]